MQCVKNIELVGAKGRKYKRNIQAITNKSDISGL